MFVSTMITSRVSKEALIHLYETKYDIQNAIFLGLRAAATYVIKCILQVQCYLL